MPTGTCARRSRKRCAALASVKPPLHLDLLALPMGAPIQRHDAIFCANLLHISPWATSAALMRLAASHLLPGGLLAVYGPFEVEGEPLAPSNRAFDADLRARDPQWGLRRLGDVQLQARQAGLIFERRVSMPANNLMVLWRQPQTGCDAG